MHSPARMPDLALEEMPPLRSGLGERAAAAGPSFEDVYREHVGFVWRSLRHLGVAEPDAEDAMQDVFVVVHGKLAGFEHRSKLSTWLYGICLRVAQARRRRAHVRREVAVDPAELLADASSDTPDASDAAQRRQAEAMLDAILDTMPIEQRAAFTLFELDGCSCEAIAELTSAPLGTVYSRLRLAREAFRRATARLEAQARFQESGGGR